MSGSVSGIDYSLLFNNSSTVDAAANILATVYSGTSSSSASSGTTATSTGNPILDMKLAEQNETKDVAQEAKNPIVLRAIAAFKQGIANAKTLNAALQNPNVLQVLLTANGLGDEAQYPALASKILQSNPNDPNSLVNTISNTQWKSVVESYNLSSNGLKELQNPTVQAQIASSYEQVTWLNSLDQATPGLAEALQFKQQASSITNVYQILGDPINWQVVLTALGIPQQIAYQSESAQAQEVTNRLNIKQLQDPQFVNTLTDQYLLTMQQQNSGSSSSYTSSVHTRQG